MGDFTWRLSDCEELVVVTHRAGDVSWFTRNTKNWHIVYNWLPYSKPIERDALCPDVLVADFQTFKKRKQSWLNVQDGVPVSQVCEDLGIHPNQYYDWQK